MITKYLTTKTGEVYLRRTVICEKEGARPLSGRYGYSEGISILAQSTVFLHEIFLPDPDPHLHSHPWAANVQVIRGWYDETYISFHSKELFVRRRVQGERFDIQQNTLHRISKVYYEGCVTLLTIGSAVVPWYFLVGDEMINSAEYIRERDKE